jgi:hypothetical protein
MHLIAGMTSVHVDRRSILRLDAGDQAMLVADFQRVFHDSGFHLQPLEAGDFLMLGPEMSPADTQEPARAMGASMAQQAGFAPALRKLGAEIEMWLHDHPINDTRRRRGEQPVTALWLWGGGPISTAAGGDVGANAVGTPAPTPARADANASSAPAPTPARADANASSAPAPTPARADANVSRPPAPTPARADANAGGTPAPTPARADANASGTPASTTADARSDPGRVPASSTTTGADANASADVGARADGSDIAFGRDSYLQGLWATRGGKVSPLPQQLADVFSYPQARRAVLAIEMGLMLQSNPMWTFFEAVVDVDRRFIAPAVEALNAGRYDRLVVLANDYELTLRSRDRLKIWRRTPPGLSGLQ